MTKPRFTPDPLPDGLDPTLASYLQRQFDRIDDWWPKDLEDRVKALEEIASGIGGVWPIVDYSVISFTGEAQDSVAELSCPLTSTVVDQNAANRTPYSAYYSPSADLCLFSILQQFASPVDPATDPGVFIIDPNDDSQTQMFAAATHYDAYHPMFVSPYGEINNHKYVMYYVQDTAFSSRDRLIVYDIDGNSYTNVGPYDPDRLNDERDRTPVAESPTHIMTRPNDTYFAGVTATSFLTKNLVPFGGAAGYASGSWTRCTMPAGWTDGSLPAGYHPTSGKFIGLIPNASASTNYGLAVFATDGTVTVTNTDITSIGTNVLAAHMPVFYRAIDGYLYFCVDWSVSGTQRTHLLKVDGNGNLIDAINTGTRLYSFSPTNAFCTGISYDSVQDAVYSLDYDDYQYLARFIIATETLEKCPINAPAGYHEAIYEGTLVKPEGKDFLYASDNNAQPTSGTFEGLIGKIALT